MSLLIIISYCPGYLAQINRTIMSYNLLNYPGNTSAERNPYFRTTFGSLTPDILVVQEILSQAGVDEFLNNVLNVASTGYTAGIFIDGPDTDNAIFLKSDAFSFVANNVISTSLRDINEFVLTENSSGDTLRIYSLHLKAGTSSTDKQRRLEEVTALRDLTNTLPEDCNFIVCGDFNIYSADELAYQKLLDQSDPGYFVDIFNLPGTWNNPAYASYHTQSPRTRQFQGGATGGMDDRFDMILMSQSIMDSGDVYYLPGSFITYGNDGYHYNDSINNPPNYVVSQDIANSLHYASDHLPVIVTLRFEETNTTQMAVNLIQGWNLLSVPLLAEDMTAESLFPFSASFFYTYNNGYQQTEILENGEGYWAKFDFAQSVMISGTYVNTDEIPVFEGWNLVGPFDIDVNINTIITNPPNIIISPFYGYEGGYLPAEMLKPGKGYWVKTNSAGSILFNQSDLSR